MPGEVVRMTKLPWWHGRRHYIPFGKDSQPGRFFYGFTPQKLRHSQEELNSIHNQRFDATQMTISKCFKELDTRNAEADPVQIYPGAVIQVGSMDEVEEFLDLVQLKYQFYKYGYE